MRRLHPFVAGHVVTALILGAVGGAMLDMQAALMGATLLGAGAAVSSLVCWWKPGLEAPAWLLVPAAILASPLMLLALGFVVAEAECLVGSRRGWDCVAAAIAVVVAGASLVPPFGGLLWRWWTRRSKPAPS